MRSNPHAVHFILVFGPDCIAIGAIVRFVLNHKDLLGFRDPTPTKAIYTALGANSQLIPKPAPAMNTEIIPPHPRSVTVRAAKRLCHDHRLIADDRNGLKGELETARGIKRVKKTNNLRIVL